MASSPDTAARLAAFLLEGFASLEDTAERHRVTSEKCLSKSYSDGKVRKKERKKSLLEFYFFVHALRKYSYVQLFPHDKYVCRERTPVNTRFAVFIQYDVSSQVLFGRYAKEVQFIR